MHFYFISIFSIFVYFVYFISIFSIFSSELAEEDIIDGLAELTAGRGVDPVDLEDSRTLYYLATANRPMANFEHMPSHKELKVPLQRQFGYGPRDPRFYLPKEELPKSSANQEPNEVFGQFHDEPSVHEPPPPPYMKKSSHQERDSGDGDTVVDPIPSHVMTSSHAVDHSGPAWASRLPDQSYSSLYIGKHPISLRMRQF